MTAAVLRTGSVDRLVADSDSADPTATLARGLPPAAHAGKVTIATATATQGTSL